MWKISLIIKIAGVTLLIGLAVICIGGGSSSKSDDWRTSSITENGTVAGYPLGSALIGDPQQIGPDVRIYMADTLCQEQECRVLAVGIDGKTHLGEKTVSFNPGRNCRSTVLIFSNIGLEDIEKFQFQTRPHREGLAEASHQPRISDAARKKRLINQACEGRLFESNYIN